MTKQLLLRITTFGSLFSNILSPVFKSHKHEKLDCACLESQRIIPLKRNLTLQSQKIVAGDCKKNRTSANFGNVHTIQDSSLSCRHENLSGFV